MQFKLFSSGILLEIDLILIVIYLSKFKVSSKQLMDEPVFEDIHLEYEIRYLHYDKDRDR